MRTMSEIEKQTEEFYKGFTPWRVEYPKMLRFVKDCAEDRDDCVSPGLKKRARDILAVESLPMPVQRGRCPHPPENVTADILEGDYHYGDKGVRWCRLCGAYQRFFGNSSKDQEWREPAIELTKPPPPNQPADTARTM